MHYKWVDGIGSPAENEKEKVGINNNGIPTKDTYACIETASQIKKY